MLRSQTVNTIHDLHTQGKSIQAIAQELGVSRTTVRKYLKHPEAVIRKPRPPQPSKLNPFNTTLRSKQSFSDGGNTSSSEYALDQTLTSLIHYRVFE